MNIYSGFISDAQIGDIVSVQKGPFTHVGVVVSNGILQNSPGSHERVVSRQEFAGGQTISIQRTNVPVGLILQRAAKILANPKNYDTLFRNCEHTVNEVVNGSPESPQVGLAVVGVLLGAALVGLLAA